MDREQLVTLASMALDDAKGDVRRACNLMRHDFDVPLGIAVMAQIARRERGEG